MHYITATYVVAPKDSSVPGAANSSASSWSSAHPWLTTNTSKIADALGNLAGRNRSPSTVTIVLRGTEISALLDTLWCFVLSDKLLILLFVVGVDFKELGVDFLDGAIQSDVVSFSGCDLNLPHRWNNSVPFERILNWCGLLVKAGQRTELISERVKATYISDRNSKEQGHCNVSRVHDEVDSLR